MLRPGDIQDGGLDAVAQSRSWSLFLDLDGTLLDIAETPSAVRVPPDLLDDLSALRSALGGALAIVSGRAMNDIDRLLFPLKFTVGAEHGSAVREPDGRIDAITETIPAEWVDRLQAAARESPGVLVEVKAHAVAVHFRLAMQYLESFRALAESMLPEHPGRYEIMPARRAFEIRHHGVDKGRVVERLMRLEPFRGRVPVFVGDDVTDLAGMAAASALGGFGLHVAEVFENTPSKVRAWVKRLAGNPSALTRVAG